MLPENVTECLDMFALGAISQEDVCYLLGREEFFLTEEESTYVGCLQRDYDAWLVEQMMLDEERNNIPNNQT